VFRSWEVGKILLEDEPKKEPTRRRVLEGSRIINLKTAKALGITVPLPLLGRADEAIE
jgi:putative ABC transport system substrate-binding protein